MVDDFPISLEKAKEQRLELMEERKRLYAIYMWALRQNRLANDHHSVVEQTEHMEGNTFSVGPHYKYFDNMLNPSSSYANTEHFSTDLLSSISPTVF